MSVSDWKYDQLKLRMRAQEAHIQKLREQLTEARENNERRNRELDAMHYVWCDGGCETGVHRYDELGPEGLTEEIVALAERNTKRLRKWLTCRQHREARKAE